MKNTMVVIGGSAGSFQIIADIIKTLPSGFPFPVLIVHHISSDTSGMYIEIWDRESALIVQEIYDGLSIEPGHVYVAPPDYHILIETYNAFRLTIDNKVNYSRPSIDYAIESVLDIYKEKTIGVLLSGSNSDGAKGMQMIDKQGGITIIQHPDDAEYNAMPKYALKLFMPQLILSQKEIQTYLSGFYHRS